MRHRFCIHTLIALCVTAGTTATPLAAQGLLGRVKQKAKDAATRTIEKRVDQETTKATDAAIDKAVGTDAATESGTASSAAATTGNAATATASANLLAPGQGAWANYDFKPGDRILVAEDFSADVVGNFPRRFEFKGGSIEIVEWQGQRWLKSGDRGEFVIPLPEVLPSRFTMEFDLTGSGNGMEIHFIEPHKNKDQNINFSTRAGGVQRNGIQALGETGVNTETQIVKARVMADGEYVKVFVNEKRVANVPNAKLGRSDKIYFMLNGWSEEKPRMIANVRIAAGGTTLYDALTEQGRVATQGIYFDVGSHTLRPESTPTLVEIGTMLQQHPELRLTIEGHTDATGNPAANETLSQRRAEAVSKYLQETYQVAADRLMAKGYGQSKPVASNETAEGRQSNRRVELVKM